jgi:hypothetical protein
MLRAVGSLCAALSIAACAAASGAVPLSHAVRHHSGIAGFVAAGPTCPVERVPPEPSCAPRPLSARLRISRQGSGREVLVKSGADGRFRVKLGPGLYVVRGLPVSSSGLPRPLAPRLVRVLVRRFTYIKILYDTGIR